MFKAYKFRIYPNETQKELISKHIGSSRFVYNLALETKNTTYLGSKINVSPFDLIKQLPELKKDFKWISNVHSQTLQGTIERLDRSYDKFFKDFKEGKISKLKQEY